MTRIILKGKFEKQWLEHRHFIVIFNLWSWLIEIKTKFLNENIQKVEISNWTRKELKDTVVVYLLRLSISKIHP